MKLGNRRIEEVCHDHTRPLLAQPYLRKNGDGWVLEATDSYRFAQVPISLDKEDSRKEGPLPLRAFSEARENPWAPIVLTDDMMHVGDVAFKRPVIDGTWPDYTKFMPDAEALHGEWRVGVDPRFLAGLSDALGGTSPGLILCFQKTESGGPNGDKGIVIYPFGGKEDGAFGLLMPIRMPQP